MLSVQQLITANLTIAIKSFGSCRLSRVTVNLLRILLSLLFCLIFALPSVTAPGKVEAASDYLLDKTVQWADGSIEHIQIGTDGYFVLDGVKRRLVGMNLGSGPSYDEEDCYWLPDNVARMDKVLTYLEAAGVRIVEFEPESIWHYGGEAGEEYERYSTVLDLVYAHKMLVMPHFVARHQPDAGDLSNCDFLMGYCDGTDTVGQWASRFADVMAAYPNVVTIIMGNELNIPYHDYDYQPENVANYLQFIKSIFNSKLAVPTVCNFAAYSESDSPVRDDIVSAGLAVTDWPCFTHYGDSLSLYNTRLEVLTGWLGSNGYVQNGYWIEETNYCSWSPPDASKFTVDYLDTLFNHGASMALLHTTVSPDNDGYSFFTDNGDPIQSMAALAAEFSRLQTPLSGSDVPPVVATGDAANITSNSADLIGTVTDLGSASTVAVSFYWGYTPDNMENETSISTRNSTGSLAISVTGLNPETTYYFRLKAQGDGVSYGEIKSFVTNCSEIETPAGPPYVETTAANNITSDSVILTGTVIDMNGADSVDAAFLVGTSEGRPDIEYTSDVLTEPGAFTREISGLLPNTTYYYRSKAVGLETGYGKIKSFTTPDDNIVKIIQKAPTAMTLEATDVTKSTAVLVGKVIDQSSLYPVTASFLYGKTPECNVGELSAADFTDDGMFSAELTGLTPGTEYYFMAKLTGSETYYGQPHSFTTAAARNTKNNTSVIKDTKTRKSVGIIQRWWYKL